MRFLPAGTLQRECRGAEQKERYRREKIYFLGPNGELASLSYYLKIDSSLITCAKPLQLTEVFASCRDFEKPHVRKTFKSLARPLYLPHTCIFLSAKHEKKKRNRTNCDFISLFPINRHVK